MVGRRSLKAKILVRAQVPQLLRRRSRESCFFPFLLVKPFFSGSGENKKKKWEIEEMEADHIKPWHEGGKTNVENCQMLCKQDNRTKSGK